MPPKRKGAKTAAAGGKKAKKTAPVEDVPKDSEAVSKLKAAHKGGKKTFAVDSRVPGASAYKVHEDYDCMLNQTNIGHNNNKYYVIQLLTSSPKDFYTWNRWGRVGEPGQTSLKIFGDVNTAIKDFEKKFRDKTSNVWANRNAFVPKAGKYTLLEMADIDEEDSVDAGPSRSIDFTPSATAACTLDNPTQLLIKLIFDQDMFKTALQNFEIDTKKMPLGKISKAQIAKGFECLEEIEAVIEKKSATKETCSSLSSKFYTLIPHNFGRKVPPVINTMEVVRKKMDMLLVLGDIEIAQSMQKDVDSSKKKKGLSLEPHPLDVNYGLLNCELELLDKKSEEYKILETYTKVTGSDSYRAPKIKYIWKMERDGEADRFKQHSNIEHRKLLWHGTNFAVVAAILKGGLRIMPHSGGRVGKGIYFASENAKSAGYVRTCGSTGIMFLNEVALGKEKDITMDNYSLKSAPAGYDSIVARGRTEPDPKFNITKVFDGKKVIIPQGKPISQPKFNNSNFYQSEYLVYRESQNKMRYLIMVDF